MNNQTTTKAEAILFDKDGTLFDFGATWNVWAKGVIVDLSGGDAGLAEELAQAAGYDLEASAFRPDSIVIAGTNREAATVMVEILQDRSVSDLELYLARTAALAPLVPAVPLPELFRDLAAFGLSLGVMTNDSAISARAHLEAAEVLHLLDFVAGADSGYGAKPDPGPLLAFCDTVGVAPDRAVMVGDSTHDLHAGRAAGMQTIGVLTGPAVHDDLAPFADAVLPDIGHLAGWLSA